MTEAMATETALEEEDKNQVIVFQLHVKKWEGKHNEIIEIGAVNSEHLKMLAEFETKIIK